METEKTVEAKSFDNDLIINIATSFDKTEKDKWFIALSIIAKCEGGIQIAANALKSIPNENPIKSALKELLIKIIETEIDLESVE